jgi:hypothetical protein
MTTPEKSDPATTRSATDRGSGATGGTNTGPGRGTVTADLERPIPLLGRRAQHLGSVRKLTLSLEDRSIRQIELTTPWQTLQLHGATVAFDERRGVFRLRRRERSGSRGAFAQSSSSSAS